MQKKDLWLFVLILVIGTLTAIRQPLFLSPINIANTANLVGLFGMFAIGQGFVIMTAGIELSSGSMIAIRPSGLATRRISASALAGSGR